MRAYTPPSPFRVDEDFQVPYYAIYFEELMHNLNVAEAELGLEPTTWHRYLSATEREAFTPLEGGEQQLVDAAPRFSNYILDMRTALERVYEALGTSKAEVLQARFGYEDWVHPEGYDVAKGEFSDRDIEELRFHYRMPGLSVSFLKESFRLAVYQHSSCLDEELTDEERTRRAWELARAAAWDRYREEMVSLNWETWSPRLHTIRLFRYAFVGCNVPGFVNVSLKWATERLLFHVGELPLDLQEHNVLVGSLSVTLYSALPQASEVAHLTVHLESFAQAPTDAELYTSLRAHPNSGTYEVGLDERQVVVPFTLTDVHVGDYISLMLGLVGPPSFIQNPFPLGMECPVSKEHEDLTVGEGVKFGSYIQQDDVELIFLSREE